MSTIPRDRQNPDPVTHTPLELRCGVCRGIFTVTTAEQRWYVQRQLVIPRTCRPCRQARRAEREHDGHV